MRPTIVRSQEDLRALEEEFRKAGDTVVHNDDNTISVYKNGKVARVVKVKDGK